MYAVSGHDVHAWRWLPHRVAVHAADVASGERVDQHLVPPRVVVGLGGEESGQAGQRAGPVPVGQGHAAAVVDQGVLHLVMVTRVK